MLDLFKECSFNRAFEYKVAEFLKNKKIKIPTYLSVGTEHIPVILKKVLADLNIESASLFGQHRCHSYYLTFIQNPKKLAKELLGKDGYGMMGSASLGGENNGFKMFGHDGLLGSNVPIAVGYSQASKIPTICIQGDAACEEDYSLGSLGWSATKKSPILFIVEDNDLSLLTTKKERRSWSIIDVAKAFGVHAAELSADISISSLYKELFYAMQNMLNGNPTLININVERHLWHAGAGIDKEPEYDYFEDFKSVLGKTIFNKIEQESKDKVEEIWKNL